MKTKIIISFWVLSVKTGGYADSNKIYQTPQTVLEIQYLHNKEFPSETS